MSWKNFFPRHQVPVAWEGLLRSGVLKDRTTKRDSSIRFEGRLQNGDVLVLWIDNPNPIERAPGEPRYCVQIWEEDKSPETIAESDSTEEVFNIIQDTLNRLGGPRMVK